jgi:hypothetical protein
MLTRGKNIDLEKTALQADKLMQHKKIYRNHQPALHYYKATNGQPKTMAA